VERAVSPDVLDELVRRIVDASDPEKIILFGSGATGTAGPHSDLDVLVVKGGSFHRGRVAEQIYMNLIGLGQAVDVIVVTPEDVERYGSSRALVIGSALRVGRVLYAA